MLLIAKVGTEKVIFSCDGWDCECMNKAEDFMTANGLFKVKEEVTLNGNLILWVKEL